jgi:hypothetical protein
MADPITAAFAAALSGAGALFTYNKDAFVFEKTLRQEEMYQRQNMRVQEVALYREDIRDLFGLTTQKMDNYLIVNTLMLGFCISLLFGVDLPLGLPDWIVWMWTLSISGAILFLLLSIWMCLHASITAQSLVVRLLTQWLRLPVPDSEEIGKHAVNFGHYEKMHNLLRLPALSKASPTLPNIPEEALQHAPDSWSGVKLQKLHLQLFRELARSWRGYDAYARVCMIMGSNQLLQALGHLSVARTFLVNQQLFASLFIVITLQSLSLLHFKLNIQPTRQQHTWLMVLLGVPPVSTFVAASFWFFGEPVIADIIAIVAVFIHLVWICFVLTLAMEDDGGMPKTFTQVGLATDIVGDDTFADYLDDQLERIKYPRQSRPDEPDSPTTNFASAQRMHSPLQTTISDAAGGDPVEFISRRLHKVMRQWNSITDGNLVLSPAEQIKRKRKIVKRFNDLCVYVRSLPGDLFSTDLPNELKELLEIKWNKVDSGIYINADTGEIRSADGSGFSESTKSHRSVHSPFFDSIKKFMNEENEDHHESMSVTHSYTSNESVRGSFNSSSGSMLVSEDPGTTDEIEALLFPDSHKTDKMIRQSSTRPWASYKQGSGLLIICWLIALVASCLLPFDITLKPAQSTIQRMHAANDPGRAIEAGVLAAHQAAHMAGRAR